MSRSAPPDSSSSRRRPLFDLSLTQMLGGSLAAATAAFLGSRLGVVGTITGAAVISVVTAVAGALYTSSMQRTRDRLGHAVRSVRSGRPERDESREQRDWTVVRRRAVPVLAGAGAVFGLAAAAVTGLELVSGTSLAGTDGSTTVSQSVHRGGDSSADPVPPTSEPSNDPPSGSTGAPASGGVPGTDPANGADTTTPSPSPTSEPQPTDEPSTTPSTTPSGTPSPTASPTASPTTGETPSSGGAAVSQVGQE